MSQRAIIERFYQIEQAEKLMQNGVEIADPNRIDIRGQVSIEQDTFIDINVIVENSSIGKNCRIGANAIISNSQLPITLLFCLDLSFLDQILANLHNQPFPCIFVLMCLQKTMFISAILLKLNPPISDKGLKPST